MYCCRAVFCYNYILILTILRSHGNPMDQHVNITYGIKNISEFMIGSSIQHLNKTQGTTMILES